MIREQDCDGSRRHTNNGNGAEDKVGGCSSRSVVMIRKQDFDAPRRHTCRCSTPAPCWSPSDVTMFLYSSIRLCKSRSCRVASRFCSVAVAGGLYVSDEGGVATVIDMMGEKLAVAGGLCVSDEGGVVTVMDVMGYKAGSGGRDVDRL